MLLNNKSYYNARKSSTNTLVFDFIGSGSMKTDSGTAIDFIYKEYASQGLGDVLEIFYLHRITALAFLILAIGTILFNIYHKFIFFLFSFFIFLFIFIYKTFFSNHIYLEDQTYLNSKYLTNIKESETKNNLIHYIDTRKLYTKK